MKIFRVTLLIFFGACNSGKAENSDVARWIRALSIKEDIQTQQLRSVYREIAAQDSSTVCRILSEMDRRGLRRNKRYQIRLRMLNFLLWRNACMPHERFVRIMHEALDLGYEIEDRLLIADVSQMLAGSINYYRDIGSAVLHSVNAADLQDQIGPENFHNVAIDRYRLGILYYHTEEYHKTIDVILRALEWRLDTIPIHAHPTDVFYVMNAWNTLGLAYMKTGNYDSAFIAFEQALHYVEIFDRPFWHGLVMGNIGDVYFLLGQYDTAYALLSYDYRTSIETSQYDNAANSLQYVARINAMRGDTERALDQLRECMQLLGRSPRKEFLANTLLAFAQVFNAHGNSDSTYAYFQKYHDLYEELEREKLLSRSEVARMRLANNESVFRIQNLQRERSRLGMLRNFSILVILLFSALGLMLLNRQRLRMQLKQQKALELQRLAEAEVSRAREQLEVFTRSIREKTALIEALEEQLQEREISGEQVKYLGELSQHTIFTEEDWDHFKSLFEKVYPGFFIRLKEQAPDISLAEQRMAALTRLKLSTREAAALLAVSPSTVHKTRQRLRQRLQMVGDPDLEAHIAAL